MSSDTFPGLSQSTGTMPVPAQRKDKELDPNKNYHTYSVSALTYPVFYFSFPLRLELDNSYILNIVFSIFSLITSERRCHY